YDLITAPHPTTLEFFFFLARPTPKKFTNHWLSRPRPMCIRERLVGVLCTIVPHWIKADMAVVL
ncbi:hypothetical protein, partial [Pseudomonas syringae]|uniref:hypothetical protein n=1 Tax=Pseudomonas syringae TaxID=317 RepID=UPI001F18A2E3